MGEAYAYHLVRIINKHPEKEQYKDLDIRYAPGHI